MFNLVRESRLCVVTGQFTKPRFMPLSDATDTSCTFCRGTTRFQAGPVRMTDLVSTVTVICASRQHHTAAKISAIANR